MDFVGIMDPGENIEVLGKPTAFLKTHVQV
jgi:hypothetical protein